MASFLKHIPCKVCGSKDNRGVWDDGSEWCFGCHDYTPPNNGEVIKKFLDKSKKNSFTQNVKLPEDAQPYLPEHAKRWLEKYNLTKDEYATLNPLYSFDRDLLIFPVYIDGEVVMYQGRYFGDNKKHPKYLTYGAKDLLHIIGRDSDQIVVTEDIISAVKVGSVTNAMPVWGSNIPLGTAIRLSKRFSELVIWLDMDKAKESLKMASMFSPLFTKCKSVVTNLDPKEYSHDEISKAIESC